MLFPIDRRLSSCFSGLFRIFGTVRNLLNKGNLKKRPGIHHSTQLMPSLSLKILEIHRVFLRIFAEADASQSRYGFKR